MESRWVLPVAFGLPLAIAGAFLWRRRKNAARNPEANVSGNAYHRPGVVKGIYVYPLDRHWRQALNQEAAAP